MGRFSVLTSTVLIAVLGVIAYTLVATRTMERSAAQLAAAQFDFILSRADEAIERNLHLGLALGEVNQASAALERAMSRSPSILGADVISVGGTTLYSTDRGALGEPIPDRWRIAINDTHNETWRAEAFDSVTMGRPVSNDFGQVEGWAALIIDRDALSAPLSEAPRTVRMMLPAIILVALGALVIAAVVIRWSYRRAWIDLKTPPPPPERRDAFDQANLRAVESCANTNAVLAQVRTEIQRLDAIV
ncbi:hypothetical protein RDV64_00870 [Acuticoccus sp. MNP-M23]|uniref:hypothetical protein n=1 Tax=Acuticoccus sp. MNP-M23 TaxID=3072793 RepID=UPI0028160A5C|nr:hypothetical protein [Acuticoccus sp. MNP-M23]WMS42985.1 hypothetical protein RDV64_00870 [Acuticoccus sp. MNP-M23]